MLTTVFKVTINCCFFKSDQTWFPLVISCHFKLFGIEISDIQMYVACAYIYSSSKRYYFEVEKIESKREKKRGERGRRNGEKSAFWVFRWILLEILYFNMCLIRKLLDKLEVFSFAWNVFPWLVERWCMVWRCFTRFWYGVERHFSFVRFISFVISIEWISVGRLCEENEETMEFSA